MKAIFGRTILLMPFLFGTILNASTQNETSKLDGEWTLLSRSSDIQVCRDSSIKITSQLNQVTIEGANIEESIDYSVKSELDLNGQVTFEQINGASKSYYFKGIPFKSPSVIYNVSSTFQADTLSIKTIRREGFLFLSTVSNDTTKFHISKEDQLEISQSPTSQAHESAVSCVYQRSK